MSDRIDEVMFVAMLEQQRPGVLQFLRRLAPQDAEDVLQETYAKVWRLRTSYRAEGNGFSWLLRAAFRTLLDHRARLARQVPIDGSVPDLPMPQAPCALEFLDEVRHRLAVLRPIERELLLGFHGHGDSLEELATQHRLPVNTIKSHLHRARRRLQENGHADKN